MHATSSIIIAKVIAAITLTASTAGGIALATTSTPVDPHARTTSESTATGDATPGSLMIASPTSTGPLDNPENLAGSGETTDTPAAAAPDPAGGTDVVRTTPSAQAPHPTGRCRAFVEHLRGQPGRQGHPEPRLHHTRLPPGRYRWPDPSGRPAAPTSPPATPTSAPASPTPPATRTTAPRRARPRSLKRPVRARTPPTLRPTLTAAGPRTAESPAKTARTAESPAQDPAQSGEDTAKPGWSPRFHGRTGRPARRAAVQCATTRGMTDRDFGTPTRPPPPLPRPADNVTPSRGGRGRPARAPTWAPFQRPHVQGVDRAAVVQVELGPVRAVGRSSPGGAAGALCTVLPHMRAFGAADFACAQRARRVGSLHG